jgi:hypothetical protein
VTPDQFQALIAANLLAVLTGVATFAVSEWRATRDRRWQKEDRIVKDAEAAAHRLAERQERDEAEKRVRLDREAATLEIVNQARAHSEAARIKHESAIEIMRLEQLHAAELLKVETLRAAKALEGRAAKELNAVHQVLREVKTEVLAAIEVGNHAAEKFAAVQGHIVDVQQAAERGHAEQAQYLNDVATVTSDTQKRVINIEQTVVGTLGPPPTDTSDAAR